MKKKVKMKVKDLITAYNELMGGIDSDATLSDNRAYGGILRAGKGGFVECLTKQLVLIAWTDILEQPISKIEINKKKMTIKMKNNYIERIDEPKVKEYLKAHQDTMVYMFGTDVQVFVNGRLVLPIECKAYTENAMMKRIIFDAFLMKEIANIDTYYLLQLESQLGGDFGELNDITYGSAPTHALLSYVDVNIKIITLLKGERKVDKPIHKKKFFKELKAEELYKAINIFAAALKKHIN